MLRTPAITAFGLLAALAAPASVATAATASPAALTRAIEAARDDPAAPFRLEVDCGGERGLRSLRVYRGRVAVFDGERQVLLEADERRDLLQRLLASGFAEFDESYGGRRPPGQAEAALKVVCRVALDVAGQHKSSVQQLQGEQSAALLGLANGLLDAVAPLAEDGEGAASLEDGLAKLAVRDLAPEVLGLRLVSLPPDPGSEGFILRAAEGEISRQAYAPGRLVGDDTPRPMSPCHLREIVESLRAAAVWRLPVNLRGPVPTELEVAVLGQRRTVIARPGFAATDEGTEQAFEGLVGRLARVDAACPGER